MWRVLRTKNLDPSSPVKFAIGLLLLGAGFMCFNLGASFAVDGMVPVIYLVLAYLLQTLGELCLSPVGLSLVTKLAPARIVGFVMGIWFLSSSIAHQAGKHISNMTASSDGVETGLLSAAESLPVYASVFTDVGFVALGAGVLLLLLSPIIKKWMHGIH
jgi:POT family proton-dependent oligopeptide transporter